MLDGYMDHGLFSLNELNRLRLEAMHLFEQCLTSGDETAFIAFVEHQLAQEPPCLPLLRDLADDLQQRLLSLKEYHFDVRERVVRTLIESYGIDITRLAPLALLDSYHLLTAQAMLAYVRQQGAVLTGKEEALLYKMFDASLQMAAQLQNDIVLTTRLYQLVLDWWEGFNTTVARQNWTTHSRSESENLHH